jgi:hypothetical protein
MFKDHFHLCPQSVIYYLKLMLISKDLISKFYASFEFHLNWFIIMNVKILINYVIKYFKEHFLLILFPFKNLFLFNNLIN